MMKSRRILVVKEGDNSSDLAPYATSLNDQALLSDTFNHSALASNSSFPNSTSFDKSSNAPSANENQYDLTGRFDFSFAIIVVIVLSAFFVMGFLLVYVRRCTSEEETRGNSRRGVDGNRRMNGASQGLDRSVIEKLPVFSYSLVKGFKQGKQALACAVCLSEFEDDETLRLLPKCGHAFHPDCVDMWLFSHATCPLCRSSVVPESITAEQGMMFNVEGQLQQGSVHAAERVVIVVDLEVGNAAQD